NPKRQSVCEPRCGTATVFVNRSSIAKINLRVDVGRMLSSPSPQPSPSGRGNFFGCVSQIGDAGGICWLMMENWDGTKIEIVAVNGTNLPNSHWIAQVAGLFFRRKRFLSPERDRGRPYPTVPVQKSLPRCSCVLMEN